MKIYYLFCYDYYCYDDDCYYYNHHNILLFLFSWLLWLLLQNYYSFKYKLRTSCRPSSATSGWPLGP